MITPSPTSSINPLLARGVLLAHTAQGPTRAGQITFGVHNSNYELHLLASGPLPDGNVAARRLLGTIKAKARRVDVVTTGGRFIEPVMGRPRRVQGSVIAAAGDALVVDAGVPIHCELTDARQRVADFAVGQLVSFDVLDGATFVPTR